jgi:hypothetical protein
VVRVSKFAKIVSKYAKSALSGTQSSVFWNNMAIFVPFNKTINNGNRI